MANFFKEWKAQQKKKKKTLKISDNTPYFNFNIPKDAEENPHYPFSEELLSPFVNNCDTQRLQMFSNHINQTVHLKNPEFPKIFTGFENQVGKYSIAYKKAQRQFRIIGKVRKNAANYTLVVQYDNGIYDCIDVNHAVNICEEYGYRVNDCLSDREVGDIVKENEFIYKSDNYDDDGNFAYGVNLKACYLPAYGLTYEDGFVISESAAKKLTSFKVEKTTISVNTNDILLNLYSDYEKDKEIPEYHSIPKVGEHTKGNILVASRREDSQNVLYNFQQHRMKEIDITDQIYYTCGGEVADINIYSNAPLKLLKQKAYGKDNKNGNEFLREIVKIYEEQYNYYKELAELLETIIPAYTEEEYLESLSGTERDAYIQERKEYGFYYKRPLKRTLNKNKYTDDLDYKWKYAHEYIDDRISWRSDGKRYDNFKLEITILKENPLTVGAKCTGRYGNKGVCSAILPDDLMPHTADGKHRADICLNPLGVIGRINPAQLFEQYINFIADHVVEAMKEAPTYEEKKEIYLDFLKHINKEQNEFVDIEMMTMNRVKAHDFLDKVIEDGIYIHEPPFVGNTKMEDLVELFKDHPEWVTKYKCENIEKPLIIGDEYFIRLKHESSNKLSIRSKGMLNIKNMPSKSTLRKERKALYNDNPLRLGEMETEALFVTKRPDLVAKLLRTYSTSMDDRQDLVEQLVTAKNPLSINARKLEYKPITRQILDNYLSVLELKLDDNLEEDE